MQALAHHDPDVDAIYRLTMPIPFDWGDSARVGAGGERPLVLPRDTFAPANAQATLHTRAGLWATLLPRTVHGRVSDIWRSYIAQRLFWDVGLSLAFVGAHVTQFRSPHNYLADFDAEVRFFTIHISLCEQTAMRPHRRICTQRRARSYDSCAIGADVHQHLQVAWRSFTWHCTSAATLGLKMCVSCKTGSPHSRRPGTAPRPWSRTSTSALPFWS